jgi:hypothetical protein
MSVVDDEESNRVTQSSATLEGAGNPTEARGCAEVPTSPTRRTPPFDSDSINQHWFERGLVENNFALVYASLFPVKPEIAAAIAQRLPTADPTTIGLLVDETIYLAFCQGEWRDGHMSHLEWLLQFVEPAIAVFGEEA